MAQMLESGDKDSKRAAIIVSHMFKKLSGDEEDMKKKKTPINLWGIKYTMSKVCFFFFKHTVDRLHIT